MESGYSPALPLQEYQLQTKLPGGKFGTRKRKWFSVQCVVKPWSSSPQDVTDALKQELDEFMEEKSSGLLNTKNHHLFLKAGGLGELRGYSWDKNTANIC